MLWLCYYDVTGEGRVFTAFTHARAYRRKRKWNPEHVWIGEIA
jgi:hypothetical protein